MSSRSRRTPISALPEPLQEQVRELRRDRRFYFAAFMGGLAAAGPVGAVVGVTTAALTRPSSSGQGWT